MDRIPIDQHPMTPKTRGGSTSRRHDGIEIKVSTRNHGDYLAPNQSSDGLHDWMGYRNYSGNHHVGELEHTLPNHHHYQNYYYNYPPYYRQSTQAIVEQHSLPFDDTPSPPYHHMYSPSHRRHDPFPLYSFPPGLDAGGDINRHRRHVGEGQLDSTTSQPSIVTRFPSSTKVTPMRPLKLDIAAPDIAAPADASGRIVSSVQRSSSIGQGQSRMSIHTRHSKSSSSSDVIWNLGEHDVLCGRGAPTNYHSGNLFLRDLVAEYQTVYLCCKRSDKPAIAWKLLDIVSSRGGRFVRRNKTYKSTNFAWNQLTDKQAYEKICQALREGAPEIRRRMLQDMRGCPSCDLDDPTDGEEVTREFRSYEARDCSKRYGQKGDDTEEDKDEKGVAVHDV